MDINVVLCPSYACVNVNYLGQCGLILNLCLNCVIGVMCVCVKCDVWSLKEAGIVSHKWCGWPLNFGITMYVYNRYKDLCISFTEWKKYQMTCAGGAPPHTDTLIRPATCGRVQIGLFKTTRQCALALSSCSRNSPSNSAQGRPGRSAGLSP